jgi:hypothetical protein
MGLYNNEQLAKSDRLIELEKAILPLLTTKKMPGTLDAYENFDLDEIKSTLFEILNVHVFSEPEDLDQNNEEML